ncbi:nitrilase-related carbon-nitrogen hydrolase, partial [Candidatus Palauibacter sp.]|uniref:nitrilase-related carbon-nitrogen hydrolase n=1 Tax=Candidatus Palauibacter sp. TaxID=3101350 RepID=UPI003CC666D3
ACFHEQHYYAEGDTDAPVYETAVGRVGVAICYDRHYPEYMRRLGELGAQLVVIPQAGSVGEWPEGLFEAELRVAAFQNGYFSALCNRVGEESRLTFAGESFVVDPEGVILARGPELEETILYAEVDLARCETSTARRLFWRDRRPDVLCGLGRAVRRRVPARILTAVRPRPSVELLVVVAALVGLLAVVHLCLPRLAPFFVFYPEPLDPHETHPRYWGFLDASEVRIPTEDGPRLHAWWFPAGPGEPGRNESGRGAAIYFHGNAGHLGDRGTVAAALSNLGLDILLPDYRGYGASEGKPSEEGLYADGRAAYRWLVDEKGVDPGRLILLGTRSEAPSPPRWRSASPSPASSCSVRSRTSRPSPATAFHGCRNGTSTGGVHASTHWTARSASRCRLWWGGRGRPRDSARSEPRGLRRRSVAPGAGWRSPGWDTTTSSPNRRCGRNCTASPARCWTTGHSPLRRPAGGRAERTTSTGPPSASGRDARSTRVQRSRDG